jgi:hypothetical protein
MILFTPNRYSSEELGILLLAQRVQEAANEVGTASRDDYSDAAQWDKDVGRVDQWAEAFFKACANYKGERFKPIALTAPAPDHSGKGVPVPTFSSIEDLRAEAARPGAPDYIRDLAQELAPDEEPPHPAEDGEAHPYDRYGDIF